SHLLQGGKGKGGHQPFPRRAAALQGGGKLGDEQIQVGRGAVDGAHIVQIGGGGEEILVRPPVVNGRVRALGHLPGQLAVKVAIKVGVVKNEGAPPPHIQLIKRGQNDPAVEPAREQAHARLRQRLIGGGVRLQRLGGLGG